MSHEEYAIEQRLAFDLEQEIAQEPTAEQLEDLNAYFDRVSRGNEEAPARWNDDGHLAAAAVEFCKSAMPRGSRWDEDAQRARYTRGW